MLFLVSCTNMTGNGHIPPVSPEAASLIAALENQNNKLKTFKGTGKIVFRDKYNVQISRAAWIGDRNKKLRVSLLNLSGQPAASFSSDGEYFYAVSHLDRRFYKKKSSDPGLKQIMTIPVKSSSLIQILCGRVPVKEFYSALIVENNYEYILVLKSFWGNILEKIWFNKQTKEVIKFENYNSGQEIKYQVIFENYKTASDYSIPYKLLISSKDAQFELEIDRYWADVPISPSAFILTDPDKKSDK